MNHYPFVEKLASSLLIHATQQVGIRVAKGIEDGCQVLKKGAISARERSLISSEGPVIVLKFRLVINVVGFVVIGLSILALLPAAVDKVDANLDWQSFAVSSTLMAFVGLALVLATRDTWQAPISFRTAFLLTASIWIAVPLVGALPFMGLGISYVDSFFEATSGLTTTGSTVLSGLDELPKGILLWRSLLQWIGGVGIIIMAVVMLPFLRIGGAQLFKTESSETNEKAEARWTVLLSNIVLVYCSLTVACVVAYWILGMSFFDAICHAMASVSTGGYSTHDASFGYFEAPGLHWASIVFMISGALPFYIYVKAVRGNFRALFTDSQIRVLIGFLAVTSLVMTVWLSSQSHMNLFAALTLVSFNVTSIVTTTGFASTDYTLWGPGAVGLFLILMFVGGCSGSTSGAIKIYRFQVLIKVVHAHLQRLVSPHRTVVIHYNGRLLPDDAAFSILAFLAVFVATIGICTLILGFLGLDIVTAASASITAITNVGPGLGEIIGPAGNFATLPDSAKWLLSFAMILGRLEIFTMLVMVDRGFWSN